MTNTNGSVTGGSKTSELNCYVSFCISIIIVAPFSNWLILTVIQQAAMRACQKLKKKMLPVREKMHEDNWAMLVEQCYNSNVDLTARHLYVEQRQL